MAKRRVKPPVHVFRSAKLTSHHHPMITPISDVERITIELPNPKDPHTPLIVEITPCVGNIGLRLSVPEGFTLDFDRLEGLHLINLELNEVTT